MGQARKRGTFDVRRQQAIQEGKTKDPKRKFELYTPEDIEAFVRLLHKSGPAFRMIEGYIRPYFTLIPVIKY